MASVHRFVGRTFTEALANVRTSLGPDAIIVGSRIASGSGPISILVRERIQLLAEEGPSRLGLASENPPGASAGTPVPVAAPAVARVSAGWAVPRAPLGAANGPEGWTIPVEAEAEADALAIEAIIERAFRSSVEVHALEAALEELSALGVESWLVDRLGSAAREVLDDGKTPGVRAVLRKIMADAVREVPWHRPSASRPRIEAVVGPRREARRSVCAALEEAWRARGQRVMAIGISAASLDREGLTAGASFRAALARCRGADVIIVDADGEAPLGGPHRDLESVLRGRQPVGVTLALPAAPGIDAGRYAALRPDALVFWGIAGPASAAAAFNVAARSGLPVAGCCPATGPSRLAPASGDLLAQLLLADSSGELVGRAA